MESLMTKSMSKKQPNLLREIAYVKIKDAILKGEFKSREFLSESKLIDLLGMSKTPIKSAIDRLETEGLVQVAPKQGIIVTELSLEKVRDIFDLRIALETFVGEQICGKISPPQQKEIETNLHNSKVAANSEDEFKFAESDFEFHLLLCQYSRNAELYKIISNYHAQLFRIVLNVLQKEPGRMVTSHKDHVDIYEALLHGELSKATDFIKEHLNYGKSTLLN